MSIFKDVGEYFRALYAFNRVTYGDKFITPACKLLFRVLIEQANLPDVCETLSITNEKLMRLTGLGRDALIAAKARLAQRELIKYKTQKKLQLTHYHINISRLDQLDDLIMRKSEESSPRTPLKEKKYKPECARIARGRGGEMEYGRGGAFRQRSRIIRLGDERNGIDEDNGHGAEVKGPGEGGGDKVGGTGAMGADGGGRGAAETDEGEVQSRPGDE